MKKSVKGFTLIELIIVLAIFSVIMTLVMSFIDPVSKLMSKTSVRERTSAYVDNIDDYITKSIRYAQTIQVYPHGLWSENCADASACTENIVVRDFVDSYYDNALSRASDNSFTPLTGKVHVLKLINTPVTETLINPATGLPEAYNLEAGKVYESVYSFTSGMGKPESVYYNPITNTEATASEKQAAENHELTNPGETADYYFKEVLKYTSGTKYSYDTTPFHHADVTWLSSNVNVSVLNDEHFKEYSYYYQLGMSQFNPITDLSSYSPVAGGAIPTSDKYFYSRLSAPNFESNESDYQFVLSIVSFMNDKANSKIDCVNTVSEGVTENVTIFKSPAAMHSAGITFKNAKMSNDSRAIKYYQKELDSDGNVVQEGGQDKIVAVKQYYKAKTYQVVREAYDSTANNIYFVYTVPNEINDTEWNKS